MINGLLVIVSCGSQKIWNRYPTCGPTAARDAYTSSVFKTSRRYAEMFAKRWLILSAKYGFIEPSFVIPENYNRSFYDPNAISDSELNAQVESLRLSGFNSVGVLGSDAYWNRVVRAFAGSDLRLRHVNGSIGFPPLFQRLVGELIRTGKPFSTTSLR
ncbi:MAG: DUF6884 domain-containing protein [Terriglobales bacterium]